MTKEGMSANNSDLAMKMVGFSVASMIFLFLIYRLKVLLICIVLALTLSAALSPIVESAQRKKIPRIVTVLLLYVLAALIYGLVAALLIPAICEQWHKLLENLPAYMSGIDRWYQKVLSFAGNNP
ncbi:MAG: AI-2E family transporter, partial [Candidatus Obscuribacterales bacterium]|nr:AI-2E family transporter [Candidatus Obscuribacterales bacterium]